MRAIIVLCVIPLALSLASCNKPEKVAESTGGAEAQASAQANNAGSPNSDASSSQQNAVTGNAGHPSGGIEGYLCQPGASACNSSGPLAASSEEEARWLIANGYPSEAELARLNKLSLAQLKAESDAGNKAAAVVYGKKTAIVAGRFEEGLSILRNAALSGNLYSYYGLSDIYASETKNKNLIDSTAYLRLAYLLGDSKASADIALRGLSSVENVAADERAASLQKTFSQYRKQSPRPIE